MNENNSAVYGEVEAGRSSKVRQILENMRQTISTINFDMAETLAEATEKNYFREWGYETRAAYVEQNLDIKEREVQYLIRISTVSRSMGYAREDIEGIAISKLKQIFSLEPDGVYFNPETQENEPLEGHIRRLVDMAHDTGLDAIKAEVRKLKGLVGDNDLTWMNYQVTRLTKENVVLPGMEAFRKYLGSKGAVEREGTTEYSDGFVLEMIFAEILSGMPSESSADLQDEVVIGGDEEDYAEAEAA